MTLLLTLLLTVSPATEQTTPAPTATTGASATIGSVKGMLGIARDWLTKAAAQLPEEHYAFKPTPDVRTAGEIFAHIADANFGICGMATGQKPPMTGISKTKKTKAELTEALTASFDFCDSAFNGMTDAQANEVIKFFLPGTHTRLGVLAFNAAHDFEHYGNIVTYMRMKGLVPPSSAGGM